jgi:hypothetical protein
MIEEIERGGDDSDSESHRTTVQQVIAETSREFRAQMSLSEHDVRERNHEDG